MTWTRLPEALYRKRLRPWERGSLTYLVAATEELRGAVRDQRDSGHDRDQRRKQQAALCYLLATLSQHHLCYRRRRLQAEASAACGNALHAHFGLGGLGGDLTVLRQQCLQAHALAHEVSPDALAWAQRLRAIHANAVARGRRADKADIYCDTVDALGELEPGAYGALATVAPRYLDGLSDPAKLPCRLAWAAAAEGLQKETERHLADWVPLDHSGILPLESSKVLGWLALARGEHDEAERQFREAVGVSEQLGYPTPYLAELLELCDRARLAGQPVFYRDYRLNRTDVVRNMRGARRNLS